MVLDNVNLTHLMEEEGMAGGEDDKNTGQEDKKTSLGPSSPHPGCLEDRSLGDCKASFRRYYYRC